MGKRKIRSIVSDDKRYHEKHVALKDFNSREVVAFGKDPLRVAKKAKKKGCKEPVIVFVPKPGTVYLYNAA